MILRPPRPTLLYSSAASDVYKRQVILRRERVLDGRPHFLVHVGSYPLLPKLFALKRQREPVIDTGGGLAHQRRTQLQHLDIGCIPAVWRPRGEKSSQS